jgi:hypothetical protein
MRRKLAFIRPAASQAIAHQAFSPCGVPRRAQCAGRASKDKYQHTLGLCDWTNGISEPPWTIFERMVDLVIEYQSQQIRANREALNKWRATIRGKDSRQKKTPGVEVRRGSGAVEPEGNTA